MQDESIQTDVQRQGQWSLRLKRVIRSRRSSEETLCGVGIVWNLGGVLPRDETLRDGCRHPRVVGTCVQGCIEIEAGSVDGSYRAQISGYPDKWNPTGALAWIPGYLAPPQEACSPSSTGFLARGAEQQRRAVVQSVDRTALALGMDGSGIKRRDAP